VCGRRVSGSAHMKVTLSGVKSTLSVDHAEALATSPKERLMQARKLQLIMDIDNTLLEATASVPPPGVPSIRAILLNQGRSLHHIKLRPGLEAFLEKANSLFEMTLYTHGKREYANQVCCYSVTRSIGF
jgi:RNA polymerase II subunit A C-terminal domain phosphatase